MKEWVPRVVSDEEFYEGMRRAHIPEHLIQEFKQKGEEAIVKPRRNQVQSSIQSSSVDSLMAQGDIYKDLHSGNRSRIVSMAVGTMSVVSAPENDAGAARDRDLENKLGVFKASLEARLRVRYKENAVVSVVRKFLRDNLNVFFQIDVSVGGFSYKGALRIVGSSYDLGYQFSVFGVKMGYAVGIGFLNDGLVVRVMEDLEVLWTKTKK